MIKELSTTKPHTSCLQMFLRAFSKCQSWIDGAMNLDVLASLATTKPYNCSISYWFCYRLGQGVLHVQQNHISWSSQLLCKLIHHKWRGFSEKKIPANQGSIHSIYSSRYQLRAFDTTL